MQLSGLESDDRRHVKQIPKKLGTELPRQSGFLALPPNRDAGHRRQTLLIRMTEVQPNRRTAAFWLCAPDLNMETGMGVPFLLNRFDILVSWYKQSQPPARRR